MKPGTEITGLSADAVQAIVEANLQAFWQRAGEFSDRRWSDDGHLCRVSSVPFASPNLLYRPRWSDGDPAPYIDHLVSEIAAGMCPRFWVRGGETMPDGFYALLERAGFVEFARRPLMALDTGWLGAPVTTPVGAELDRLTTTGPELDVWLQIAAAGFANGADMGRDLYARHFLALPSISLHRACVNGEPVGTAILLEHEGVMGLHLVSVLASHRGRGIGTWVTDQLARRTLEMGYRAMVLKSSQLGERIYRGLGFRDYGRLIIYEWRRGAGGAHA
jgi:GNAT superfamily N-acetyltransferase